MGFAEIILCIVWALVIIYVMAQATINRKKRAENKSIEVENESLRHRNKKLEEMLDKYMYK